MLTIEKTKELIFKCEKCLNEPRDPDHPETLKIKQQLQQLKATLSYIEEQRTKV